MNIWFAEHNWPWNPDRYRFPTEQMLLTLFPGEKPQYPETPPDMEGGQGVLIGLSRGRAKASVSVLVKRGGRLRNGVASFPADRLDEPEEQVYHTVSHALKQAFYQAGTALLGYELPWGSLTGVRPVKLPTRAMLAGKTARQAQRELEKEYRVSAPRAALAAECARAALSVNSGLARGGMALYLGVPFCPTRCAYCSFISADVKGSLALVEPYVDALCREIELAGTLLRERGLGVSCAYMGGGTPTTLSGEQLDRLLAGCAARLPLEGCTEYTVEAGRPDTITREKLEVLVRHGVGRISINPQTLEDHVLAAIGRRHSARELRTAFEMAAEMGFSCVNMDLIAGLPQDSFEGFRRSLEGVLEMNPENVTVHTLALKKGSRLMEEGGRLPKGEEVLRMLDYARERLTTEGYIPYYLYRQKYMSGALENVGWAQPGTESLYNIVMMEELHTVVSLGAGGVTKLVGGGNILRLANPKFPQDYLSGLDRVLEQKAEIKEFYPPERKGVL